MVGSGTDPNSTFTFAKKLGESLSDSKFRKMESLSKDTLELSNPAIVVDASTVTEMMLAIVPKMSVKLKPLNDPDLKLIGEAQESVIIVSETSIEKF